MVHLQLQERGLQAHMAMVEGSSGLSEEGPSATPKGREHCSGKGKTSPREEGMKYVKGGERIAYTAGRKCLWKGKGRMVVGNRSWI